MIVTDFFNKTFIVTTVMAEPYSMYKSQPNLTGNDRYEGYAIGRCCFVESNTAFVNRCNKPGHHQCAFTQTAEISCYFSLLSKISISLLCIIRIDKILFFWSLIIYIVNFAFPVSGPATSVRSTAPCR